MADGHFANVGTSEEFIETFSGELLELVDASHIHGAKRDAVKNAIMTVLTEGLMPAFERLRQIRASVTTSLPELNRRQLYEDFARVLWHAYKDLFPKAVRLLGFEIGFLFTADADFDYDPTVWVKDLRSPDGAWTATATTRQWGGFGSAWVETTVSIRKIDKTVNKGKPFDVFSYPGDGRIPKTYVLSPENADADLQVSWLTPNHLQIGHKLPVEH